MKKQPKAVYIIENGGYTELTYEEFRRREQICPLYADKLFLPPTAVLWRYPKRITRNSTEQSTDRNIWTDARLVISSANSSVKSLWTM